jgi:hypothetical protein
MNNEHNLGQSGLVLSECAAREISTKSTKPLVEKAFTFKNENVWHSQIFCIFHKKF